MLGVVLRDRRSADRPAQPVVKGADAGEEAERAADRGDDELRVAGLVGLGERQPGDRPQRDHEAVAEREADDEAEEGPRHSRSLQCRCHRLEVPVRGRPDPSDAHHGAPVAVVEVFSPSEGCGGTVPDFCTLPWFASQLSNFACGHTCTIARIVACP